MPRPTHVVKSNVCYRFTAASARVPPALRARIALRHHGFHGTDDPVDLMPHLGDLVALLMCSLSTVRLRWGHQLPMGTVKPREKTYPVR